MTRHWQPRALHHRLDERGDAARPLAVDPVHLFTEMVLLDDRARLLAAALVVAHDELDGRVAAGGSPCRARSGDLEA